MCTGRCSNCGSPNSKFDYIGVRVKRFYCSEECRQQLLHEYYVQKEKEDNDSHNHRGYGNTYRGNHNLLLLQG